MINKALLIGIVILFFVSMLFVVLQFRWYKSGIEQLERAIEKHVDYYQILIAWIRISQKSVMISNWLNEREIKEAAIYGIKEMGQLVHDDFVNNGIRVRYWIDQKPDQSQCKEHIYKLDDELPKVDIVVVTAPFYYSDIENNLRMKGMHNVVSVANIVFDLLDEAG